MGWLHVPSIGLGDVAVIGRGISCLVTEWLCGYRARLALCLGGTTLLDVSCFLRGSSRVSLGSVIGNVGHSGGVVVAFLQRRKDPKIQVSATNQASRRAFCLLGQGVVWRPCWILKTFFGKRLVNRAFPSRRCVGETFECNRARWCGPEIDWAWAFLARRNQLCRSRLLW